MKTIEQQFRDWENSVFGYGYGTGEVHTLKNLKDFFSNINSDGTYDFTILEKNLGAEQAWLMINILCKVNIIEYGTSPKFGFLSPCGKRLMEFIQNKNVKELYDIALTYDEDMCGIDYCNCDEKNSSCKNNMFFDNK